MKTIILTLAALFLACPAFSANFVAIDPKDVEVSVISHWIADDIKVKIQGQEYYVVNNDCKFSGALYEADVASIVRDMQATVLSATSSNRKVVIDLDSLEHIRKCDLPPQRKGDSERYKTWDVSAAFALAEPAATPVSNQKRLTGWVYTETKIRNQRLKFCVTAHFAPGLSDKICPDAPFNEWGQFTFTADFTMPIGQKQVVAYEYELFTNEAASPLAPAQKDLFGPPEAGSEQHVNLRFSIIQSESASVEAGRATPKAKSDVTREININTGPTNSSAR
jgi:hypothetical protein